MKQKKSLLILCGVCLVLIAAYFALSKYNENVELEEEMAAAIEEELNTIYISEIDSDDVVGVGWIYTEVLDFQLEDEEWVYTSDEDFPLDDSFIDAILYVYGDLVAVRELVDGDSLEDYGLDLPTYYVEIEQSSGEVTEFYIGNEVDGNYYLTINDKTNIYTVSSDVVSCIAYGLADLVLDDTFPTITSSQMTEVVITEAGEETVYTEDDEGVFDTIAGGVGVLDLADCADYNASDEPETYGLDEDSRITVEFTYTVETEVETELEDEDGETEVETVTETCEATLYVGAYLESYGYYYVQVEDSDMVYFIEESTIDIILNRE